MGSGIDDRAARSLDSDALVRFRERFVIPRAGDGTPVIYLNGNSLGLMPVRVPSIVEEVLEDWARLGVEGHFEGSRPWYGYPDAFREPLARLVGARPDEVVAMNGLTVNLHLLMSSFYRPTPERYKVLMEEAAFPSDTYAVQSQLGIHGLAPGDGIVIARADEDGAPISEERIERILEERGHEIALVLLGGVNYFTGQVFDMERLARAARRQGCLVGLDLAHAIGNVPLALNAWDVDFAVWCSYKYLNAGPGAIAGAFIHERYGKDSSIPRLAGWWGNDPDTRFRMHLEREFVPREGAAGWQVSNPPVLAMAPLLASLEIFEEAGMAALRAKSVRLTGFLQQMIDGIGSRSLRVITPRDPAARGCQLSIRVLERPEALLKVLATEGVVADFRPPDVIRVAPVPLYNTFHEVWRFARILERHAAD